MIIKIIGITPTEESAYITGLIPPDRFVVFSPTEKTTMSDFNLSDDIDLDPSITGTSDALNKTKNKRVDICIHAAHLKRDEVRARFGFQLP